MDPNVSWKEQRQVQLINKGLIEVEGMKFHQIEGGFGKSKRSMLVTDIAKIHGRENREINERINLNKERFKEGIDIIDLLGIGLNDTEIKSFGFSQQAINSYRGMKSKGLTTGIYVLSERGYSKLLKVLEDDVAWEQYEKLIDGYFSMRGNNVPKLSKELQAIFLIDERTVDLGNRVEKLENTMTIDYAQQEQLNLLARNIVVQALGGKGTPAYKELNKRAFSQLWRDYKRVMHVNSYKNTAVKEFEKGRDLILNWKAPRELELMIVGANSQIRVQEM